jgi:hypothetical protein
MPLPARRPSLPRARAERYRWRVTREDGAFIRIRSPAHDAHCKMVRHVEA